MRGKGGEKKSPSEEFVEDSAGKHNYKVFGVCRQTVVFSGICVRVRDCIMSETQNQGV